ncbi:MAG: EAL domain-containing protein [Treponema sp.]|nr:EAL domain-containing protein [Candidatus Treponema caballi]
MQQQATQGLIIHFNICALIIMLIILFSIFFRKMLKGAVNKWFIALCLITILTTISDLLCSYYSTPEHCERISDAVFFMIHTPYFFLRGIILPVYTMFIIAKAGATSTVFKRNKISFFLVILPLLISVTCMLINPFMPFMFEKSDIYGYHRLPGLFILYICAAFYLIVNVCVIIRLRKLFTRTEIISLLLMAPFQLIAVLIQFFNSNLLVEMFATTCSILIITITVHRTELILHWDYGTYTKHAYLDELKSIEMLKRNVTIIFANIRNYSDILAFLPFNILSKVMSDCVETIIANETRPFRKSQIYFLDDGLFAIVADQTTKQEAAEFAGIINELLRETITVDRLEIHLIPQLCYFDCPDDINGYEGMFSFIQSSSWLLPSQKEPVDAATITGTKNFMVSNEIDSILTDAISHNRFQMYYQPIWSVKDRKYRSAEALIRLMNEKYGFVSPELFIAAAERNGAIYQIGDFIIDDVCRFIASDDFRESGLEYIEINLAVAQCLQPDLPDKIRDCVEKYGIKFSQLNLEITEREDIADQALFDRNIRALSDMGMTLSLDDYGTGYSNIQRITSIPLDIVKIDKSFVDQRDKPVMQTVIRNTVVMLKGLDKEIVVEGIEDEDAVDLFMKLNCDFIQGYYFSKPLNEKAFIEFVKEQNHAATV